jgi:hypothetical protein
MNALVTMPALWVAIFVSWVANPSEGSDRSQSPAESFRRLSADFDSAQRAGFDAARRARTEEERSAAIRLMADARDFAPRFIELARRSDNEAVAVDCLVWVVRHAFRTPEDEEAVRRIAERHIRSNRIAGACQPLGARGPEGEQLLRRILEVNPHARVKGASCLGLAFARSLLLGDVRRYRALAPDQRAELIGVLGPDSVERLAKADPATLAQEIEDWLTRVLDDYPRALLDVEILDCLPFLLNNLGPAAGRILRRVVEAHPEKRTRWEAECALVSQQMKLASRLAEALSPAPGAGNADRDLEIASIPGGMARLKAVDPGSLVREIEQRLQWLTAHALEVTEPANAFYRLVIDTPTERAWYAGTERLLRRVAESHPNRPFRSVARRCLAIYLADLARMRSLVESNRGYWVTRLGEDRVKQFTQLDAQRLSREAEELADQLDREFKDGAAVPDPKIDDLRRIIGRSVEVHLRENLSRSQV